MIALIIGIYVFAGITSAFTNFGRFLFNSCVWAIPLLPFMAIYYMIKGDEKRKAEAVIFWKATAVELVLAIIIYSIASSV